MLPAKLAVASNPYEPAKRQVVDSLRIKTGRVDLVTAHRCRTARSPGRMSGRVLRDRRDDAGLLTRGSFRTGFGLRTPCWEFDWQAIAVASG